MRDPAPTEYLLVCVYSTRRTRRDAPTASETRCVGCRATVLVNPLSRRYARANGVTLYPVCPSCTIETSDPDQLVGDVLTIPGTAEMLEADGHEDGEALIASRAGVTLREFAHNALRQTAGGQG
jgi:hypothetical protein